MSTWHQDQRPVQLWHAELWTVVSDPPGRATVVERHRDPVGAQRACDRLNLAEPKTAYVLPPHPEKK